MKLLVVTSEAITAAALRQALGGVLEAGESEVMVVAPALQESPIKFWLDDADEAIAKAKQVEAETVQRLGADGVQASGDTGESDPELAIQDALQTFAADRIVVFTHPGGDGYREDIDPALIEERFGVPVTRAELSA